MANTEDLKSSGETLEGSSPSSGTICVSCREEEQVQEYFWIEPRSAEDSSPVKFQGYICEDCAIVHWAVKV